jgi:hypothetical protein
MKMCRPDGDVTLTNGTGFFVQEGPYQQHLLTAAEHKQVPRFYVHEYCLCEDSPWLLQETHLCKSQGGK